MSPFSEHIRDRLSSIQLFLDEDGSPEAVKAAAMTLKGDFALISSLLTTTAFLYRRVMDKAPQYREAIQPAIQMVVTASDTLPRQT